MKRALLPVVGGLAAVSTLFPVALARPAAAQTAAECASVGCTPTVNEVWVAAGHIFQLKNEFVAALRQFTEAVAGTYGDEGGRIRSSIESMHKALVQWDGAILAYERLLKPVLQNAETHLALGTVYLDRSRAEDALREFRAAGRLEPGRVDVHTRQALTHILMNKPAEAAQAFLKASALDSASPVTLYRLAQQLIKSGRREEAKGVLRKFHQHQQKIPAAQDRDRAVAAPFERVGLLRQVAGVAPIFPLSLYAEGLTLLTQGAYGKAIVRLREATTLDPITEHAAPETDGVLLGAAALRQGRLQSALSHLEIAVEQAPDRGEAHRVLGIAYWADEQYANSLERFRTAIRLNPQDERARIALADVLVAAGQSLETEQALKEATRAIPGSGQAHYSLGRLYRGQLRYSEAVQEFERAITFGPLVGQDYLYESIGALHVTLANFDKAIEAYTMRIEVNPNNAEAHRKLGEAYLQEGRHDEALAEFIATLLVDPKSSEAYATIAQIYLRTARYTEAAAAARRALDIDPGHIGARYALGSSLTRLGRTEEGKKEMQEFQRLQAERLTHEQRDLDLRMIKQEASARLEQGEYEKAIELLQRVIPYEPNVAISYLNLGLVLMKTGRHREAIENFKKALELNPGADMHRHLADAYQALGQLEESRQQRALYERAKEDRLRRPGGNR